MPTHKELDQRSLAMHRLVADKVMCDEKLLDKAREILSRWHQTGIRPPHLVRSATLMNGSACWIKARKPV